MAITDWPINERPREKLLEKGPKALSDAELLAIFLRTGTQGKTAVDLARQLLQQMGGLRPLLEASQDQFCQFEGLGVAKFSQLQAVLEISRRHLESKLKKGGALTSPQATSQFLQAQLRHEPREVFAAIFMDNRHQILKYEPLFFGTIDGASVYPREVVRRALELQSAAIIFAHNHPSGIAEPSQADILITERLKEALKLVDVRVLDHLIVGDREVTSLMEMGMV